MGDREELEESHLLLEHLSCCLRGKERTLKAAELRVVRQGLVCAVDSSLKKGEH